MIETVEHETCCLAFTATSDGWLTNKLTTFSPTTLPRRMKCGPRARCNTRRPFQTRRNRSRHQHSTQQTHFRQRYHEEVHQRKRVQRLPGCAPQQTWCSDFQRLVASSGLKSSGNSMPRPTATFSWTAPGNRQERAHCSLDIDRRLQGTYRERARRRRSPHAPVPIPLNFVMRAAESPVWPARKPRPPCSLPSLRRDQAECAQNL